MCLENTILLESLSSEILRIGKGTRLSRAASTILQERLLARKGWRSTFLPSLQTSCLQTCHSDAVFRTTRTRMQSWQCKGWISKIGLSTIPSEHARFGFASFREIILADHASCMYVGQLVQSTRGR